MYICMYTYFMYATIYSFSSGKHEFKLSFSIFTHPAMDAPTTIESLSTRVFETRTATGSEHFACQESIAQIMTTRL